MKLRYYPYGQEIGTVTANDRVKFGTYTRDSGSILDYAMNRYYQSTWGRFTSPDPYRASGGPGDPGSWNRYAYVQGDPVNSFDPSGLLTLIMGGTWNGGADWGLPGSEMNQAISAYFGEQAEVFNWSGSVFPWDRWAEAKRLRDFIDGYTFKPGEKLNIVAHSHGGNVVKDYTNLNGAVRIDALITMGTPQREDTQINRFMVGTYLNIYSKWDMVQRFGGPLWFLWAGRTDMCAINIGIDKAPGVGKVDHFDLHTVGVWNEMMAWLVRAGYGLNPQNATVTYCNPTVGLVSGWGHKNSPTRADSWDIIY